MYILHRNIQTYVRMYVHWEKTNALATKTKLSLEGRKWKVQLFFSSLVLCSPFADWVGVSETGALFVTTNQNQNLCFSLSTAAVHVPAKPLSRRRIFRRERINMISWNMQLQHLAREIYAMLLHYPMERISTNGLPSTVSTITTKYRQYYSSMKATKWNCE